MKKRKKKQSNALKMHLYDPTRKDAICNVPSPMYEPKKTTSIASLVNCTKCLEQMKGYAA